MTERPRGERTYARLHPENLQRTREPLISPEDAGGLIVGFIAALAGAFASRTMSFDAATSTFMMSAAFAGGFLLNKKLH